MAVLDINWNDIIVSDEYTNDLAMLTKIAVDGLGIEEYLAADNPFIFAIANLVSIQRYFIRHQVDLVDIDVTPFLGLIQQEIGFDLPLSPEMPILEWLRESKSWYGHKGALGLMPFIGALVGSPLEIDYPATLIARWDASNTYLDGKVTAHGGKLRFVDSKQARIRDGIRWAQFVYFVEVLQAQNVTSFTDLLNLLNNVHPAGTKRFMYCDFNEQVDMPAPSLLGDADTFTFGTYRRPIWPTLDNGLDTDMLDSRWDMHFTGTHIFDLMIDDLYAFAPGNAYRQLSYDTLTNIYVGIRTYTGVQRQKWNPHTVAYDQYYSDNDAIVYENVTTNCGYLSYSYGELNELNYRQLQHMAANNDQKNMSGQNWMPDLLVLDVIQT